MGSEVEPSQIPVDRLAPFLRAEGAPPLFGLVGHPVAHSLSPALHSRWMREQGEVGLYVPLDFESEREFVESVPALEDGGFRGLNITSPYKLAALELATQVGPGAAACGVANTLVFEADEVAAENTDLAAILRRLGELRSSGLWDGSSVGVVGTGGAARATLAATRTLGVTAQVWGRQFPSAESLAREFGGEAIRDPAHARPGLVVHATSAGRGSAESEPPAALNSWIRPGIHVLDWVYAPEERIVHDLAERHGATYEDGLRLLAYQAAASYGIWWGEEPAAELIAEALEAFA